MSSQRQPRIIHFARTLTIIGAACAAMLAGGGASAYTLKLLHSFCTDRSCRDGAEPNAGLVMDSAGNLYGTTSGDIGGFGPVTVFELEPNLARDSWKFKLLYTFCNSFEGCSNELFGGLIVDISGNLYGLTETGGTTGAGYVFELVPSGEKTKRTLKILHQFCSASGCADGKNGTASLTYAGAESGGAYDGTSPLFGVTRGGGAQGGGTAFQLTPNGGSWDETVIYNFCSQGGSSCSDGALPSSRLLIGGNGNLYGVTLLGGTSDSGVVFELTNSSGAWSETKLHDFCARRGCNDGGYAESDLLMDSTGALLGATAFGGGGRDHCCGVIFKLVPNGAQSQYTVLYSFCSQKTCKDGAQPRGGLLLDEAGNLFGTTNNGGRHYQDTNHWGAGTAFEFTGSARQTLYDFCAKTNCKDGEYPSGNLIMDSSGNLFGTAQFGGASQGGEYGGTVFELMP
jgi:uncharacterized repeat protein (TIGR03803 family)